MTYAWASLAKGRGPMNMTDTSPEFDVFAKDYGSQEWLMEGFGIRAPQIADCVRKAIAS